MDQESRSSFMTNVLIGMPASPVKKKRMKSLSKMLSDIEPVREAHLPQVSEIGSNHPPSLVFFVVVDPASEIPDVMATINARLKRILDRGETLDVRPITKDFDLLPTIRDANCIVGWRD
jgi:hypothetical protein